MVQKIPNTMLEDAAPDLIGLVPVGAVVPFCGAAAPANWVFAFGQQLAKADYPALWAVVGESFGAATSTLFRAPDLRGRVAVGKDNMGGTPANRVTTAGSAVDGSALGGAGGSQFMQQHNHGVSDPGHVHDIFGDGVWGSPVGGGSGPESSAAAASLSIQSATTGISVQSTGTGTSQNVQPSIILNYIIRAK